ncbi:MAG: hypothetical protein IKO47_00830 [Ruminococcus sp.]|nr:hypothetical protein [Ruminococcus sp.]
MEYEKNTGNFSFGFGSMKTAGSGSIDKAVEAPKNVRTKYDKKVIAKNAAKAAVLSAVVLMKGKRARKKNK